MSDYDPNYVPVKHYYLVGLKCVVFNEQGKLLLLKRSDKTKGAGKWSLVGGGLEKGEDPLAGIKREAQEEAQIELEDVKPVDVAAFYEFDNPSVVICYQAVTHTKEVTSNWEHDEYTWVTKDEALQMDLSETAKNFIIVAS